MIQKIANATLDRIAFALGYVPVTQAVAMMRQQAEALGQASAVLMEVKRLISSVDTLRGVNIDGYELHALANLVADHEELEARIEAVLVHLANDDPDIEAIKRYLCGAKRIPDTVEGLSGD